MNTDKLALKADISHARFFPELTKKILDDVVGDNFIEAFLVQPETIFDLDHVHRHLTALVLVEGCLAIIRVDETQNDTVRANSELVPLRSIRSVSLSRGVTGAASSDGGHVNEITIQINWGSGHRLELEPASCTDPSCNADHGFLGIVSSDDLVLRVCDDTEGGKSMARAEHFSRVVSDKVMRA